MDGPYDYASVTICILAIIVNSVLNGGVLLAFCAQTILQQRRFGVLISLAVADLLKIIPLILEIQSIFRTGRESGKFESCLAVSTFGLYLICVTILHLLLESINRLIAIARPLRYKDIFSIKAFASLMVLVWLLPAIGIISTHAVYKAPLDWMPSFRTLMFNCDSSAWFQLHPKNSTAMTTEFIRKDLPENGRHLSPISLSIESYSGIVTVIYFVTPLVLMLLCYSVIFKISLKHIRQIKNMERNMRRLYHRLSQSRASRFFGSTAGLSTTSSVSTTETGLGAVQLMESRMPSYSGKTEIGPGQKTDRSPKGSLSRNLNSAKSLGAVSRDYLNDGEHLGDYYNSVDDSSFPAVASKCKHDPSALGISSLEDGYLQGHGREESITATRKLSTVSSTKVATSSRRNSVGPRRKRSNIIAPQDYSGNNSDFGVPGNVSLNLSDSRYAGSKDNSNKRRNSVTPIKAVDVMSKDCSGLLTSGVLFVDQKDESPETPVEQGTKLGKLAQLLSKDKSSSVPLALDANENDIESIGDFYHDDHDDVFVVDYEPETHATTAESPVQRAGSIDDQQENKKKRLWPKLWQRNSHDLMDADGVPSESVFLKIIEDLERKTKPSPQTFQTRARRVMRFSVLINRHRRDSPKDDFQLETRPTQDEVDRLETLISFAERDSIKKVQNKHVETTVAPNTSPSKDAVSMDLFGVMNGFPVLEAWAQSLKAKSEAPSNSFARFYRVIRGELRNRRQEGKLVKTLGGLFLAWIIFYVPILTFTWQRLSNWPKGAGENFGLGRLLTSWALLSSALNPIIYCLRIPEFKKAFDKMNYAVKDYFACNSW